MPNVTDDSTPLSSHPNIMKATPASRPLMRAQSGVSVMSSAFLATPSLIRFAAVRGTNCASVVQLTRTAVASCRPHTRRGGPCLSVRDCVSTRSGGRRYLERSACVCACSFQNHVGDTECMHEVVRDGVNCHQINVHPGAQTRLDTTYIGIHT